MNEATMTKPPMNGATTGEPPMEGSPTGELPADGLASAGDLAVQLTEEEWEEQADLFYEYACAIGKDEKKASEILPKLIWPAWMLKSMKKSMGANYIRKNGYNTIDADLVYGPGWLDEDDGGPTCEYSEDYKPLGKYEFPRGWNRS